MGSQDYDQFLSQFDLSKGYRIRQNNEVCSFIDWVITTYYSQPDDEGELVAMFKILFKRL